MPPSDKFKLGMAAAAFVRGARESAPDQPAVSARLPSPLSIGADVLAPSGRVRGLPPLPPRFSDLPVAALQLIARRLDRRADVVALSVVAKHTRQSLKLEVQIAQLTQLAAHPRISASGHIDLATFRSILGKAGKPPVDPPQTIRDLQPQDRGPALAALMAHVSRIAPGDGASNTLQAFDEGFAAVRELPLDQQAQALLPLWSHGLLRLPDDRKEAAFDIGFDTVKELPLDHQEGLLLALLNQLWHLPPAQITRVYDGGRAAVDRLEPKQQLNPLNALHRHITSLPEDRQQQAFSQAVVAISKLSDAHSALALRSLFSLIQSMRDTHRREAFDTGLAVLLRLPPAHRGKPLHALSETIHQLPPDQRESAFDAALAAVRQSAPADVSKALEKLLWTVGSLPPQHRQAAFDNGLTALKELPDTMQARLMVGWIDQIGCMQGLRRPAFDQAFVAVKALPPAERMQPLTALVEQLDSLAEYELFNDFSALVTATSELPVEDQKPPLSALIGQLERVEPARQHDAFNALITTAKNWPVAQQDRVFMSALLRQIPTLDEDQRPQAFHASLDAVRQLPPPEQIMLFSELVRYIGNLPEGQRPAAFAAATVVLDRLSAEQPLDDLRTSLEQFRPR